MNKFTKKQLLVGALILLFAINLAALGTIIYQNHQSNRQTEAVSGYEPGNRPSDRNREHPGRAMGRMERSGSAGTGRRFDHFVRDRLNLDDQQFQEYVRLRKETRDEQVRIAGELSAKRNALMEELTTDEPDQEKLSELAKEIGQLHTRLKKNTIEHFKNMRSICRPEQMEELNDMMMDMSHRGMPQHGRNRPHGRRHMKNK
jgi:Spy/CpxP family protein refolding chaperone